MDWLNYGTIEVFTIADSGVPEPTTLVIWSLLGAVAVGVTCWRKRKAA